MRTNPRCQAATSSAGNTKNDAPQGGFTLRKSFYSVYCFCFKYMILKLLLYFNYYYMLIVI